MKEGRKHNLRMHRKTEKVCVLEYICTYMMHVLVYVGVWVSTLGERKY